ncbi:hypothetical protein CMI37_30535 [Candidatus Pacearchaeota archaeon]|nr:hypothetical protein [Candidatus Pacearchaeota archaeon]
MNVDKQANDALALIWLMGSAGMTYAVDAGVLVITGVEGSPIEELVGLLKPYKEAIIAYLNVLELNKSARTDIDEAYDAGMRLE